MQYATSTAYDRTVEFARYFANSYKLHKYQITNEGCVAVIGKRDAGTLTERNWESSCLRAAASLLVCTQTPLSSKRLKARARTP